MGKSAPQLPLTPAVFHILLSLFGKERHGYDIMQQVKSDSQGAVKMGPGTLYGSLDRMIEAGLVTKGNTRDPRRIYYKLTALGQATLRAETERLSRLAAVARRQLGTACRHGAYQAEDRISFLGGVRPPSRTICAGIPGTAPRGDAPELRGPRKRVIVEGSALAAYRGRPHAHSHLAQHSQVTLGTWRPDVHRPRCC